MTTQADFETLMKLRESMNKAQKSYHKALGKYTSAVDDLGFAQCRTKLLQYKDKMYVVKGKSWASLGCDRVSIEEVEND